MTPKACYSQAKRKSQPLCSGKSQQAQPTIICCVIVLLDKVARAKVNQRHSVCDQIDQNILWLDVPVN